MDASSQESNMRLIREIRKRPSLYNSTLLSYNRKSIQDKAWNEVAQIMGWKVSLCKERWRNLRCVYIRHIKRLSQGISARPYYLMNAMRFSLPFIKNLNSKSLSTEMIEEKLDEGLEDEIDDEQDDASQNLTCENSSLAQQISREVSPEPRQQFETAFLPSPSSHMKHEDPVSQTPDLNLRHAHLGTIKNLLKSSDTNDVQIVLSDINPNLQLQDDAKKMFLLSLLPDVYAMSDVQMRTFKQQVLNIIGNIFNSSDSSQR